MVRLHEAVIRLSQPLSNTHTLSQSLAQIVYHISMSWRRDVPHWSWFYFTVSDPFSEAGLQSIIKGLELLEWTFIVAGRVKVTLKVCSLHPLWLWSGDSQSDVLNSDQLSQPNGFDCLQALSFLECTEMGDMLVSNVKLSIWNNKIIKSSGKWHKWYRLVILWEAYWVSHVVSFWLKKLWVQ